MTVAVSVVVPDVPATTTVYIPGVVPEFPPPLLLPPQPIAPRETQKTSSPSIASQLRRLGIPKKKTPASAVPPADGQKSLFVRFSALVAAMVVTVSIEVCVVVPLMVTEAGERLHVAGLLAAVGLIEQLRLIVPVNPFDGATVIVEVFPVVAPGATVIAGPLTAKVGSPVTVRAMVVVALRRPEVPEMVTVTGPPTVAVLLAVSVSTLEPVVGLVAKAAVTPSGRGAGAARVTLPVNPPAPVTEMLLDPLLP